MELGPGQNKVFRLFLAIHQQKDSEGFIAIFTICECHQGSLRDWAYILETFAFILLNQKEKQKKQNEDPGEVNVILPTWFFSCL